MHRNTRLGFCAIGIVMPVMIIVWAQTSRGLSASQALPSQGQDQITESLLREIHELRLAIQTSNTIGTQMQILLQRVRQQEDRLKELKQSLEQTREEIANTSRQQSRLRNVLRNQQEDLKQLQDQLNSATGERLTNAQKAVNDSKEAIDANKQNLEDQLAEETRLKEKEGRLIVQVQTEQTAIDRLNERLTTLERDLPKTSNQ